MRRGSFRPAAVVRQPLRVSVSTIRASWHVPHIAYRLCRLWIQIPGRIAVPRSCSAYIPHLLPLYRLFACHCRSVFHRGGRCRFLPLHRKRGMIGPKRLMRQLRGRLSSLSFSYVCSLFFDLLTECLKSHVPDVKDSSSFLMFFFVLQDELFCLTG